MISEAYRPDVDSRTQPATSLAREIESKVRERVGKAIVETTLNNFQGMDVVIDYPDTINRDQVDRDIDQAVTDLNDHFQAQGYVLTALIDNREVKVGENKTRIERKIIVTVSKKETQQQEAQEIKAPDIHIIKNARIDTFLESAANIAAFINGLNTIHENIQTNKEIVLQTESGNIKLTTLLGALRDITNQLQNLNTLDVEELLGNCSVLTSKLGIRTRVLDEVIKAIKAAPVSEQNKIQTGLQDFLSLHVGKDIPPVGRAEYLIEHLVVTRRAEGASTPATRPENERISYAEMMKNFRAQDIRQFLTMLGQLDPNEQITSEPREAYKTIGWLITRIGAIQSFLGQSREKAQLLVDNFTKVSEEYSIPLDNNLNAVLFELLAATLNPVDARIARERMTRIRGLAVREQVTPQEEVSSFTFKVEDIPKVINSEESLRTTLNPIGQKHADLLQLIQNLKTVFQENRRNNAEVTKKIMRDYIVGDRTLSKEQRVYFYTLIDRVSQPLNI